MLRIPSMMIIHMRYFDSQNVQAMAANLTRAKFVLWIGQTTRVFKRQGSWTLTVVNFRFDVMYLIRLSK